MIEKKKQILDNALKCKNIKKFDKSDFLKAWRTVAFLFCGLHPDEVDNPEGGWTRRLKPLAREAFRRLGKGEISEEEMYPVADALKGLEARRVQQNKSVPKCKKPPIKQP